MEEKEALKLALTHAKALRDATNAYVKLLESRGEKRKARDWECSGRVWEGSDCHGCGKCDKQTKIIFPRKGGKKHVVCKACKLDYEKFKRHNPIKQDD